MKLYKHSCAGYQCGKITPSNASKSPSLSRAVLPENASVHLTCVIWERFHLDWKQAPSEMSLLGAPADMAVAGGLPAETRQYWHT